MDHAYTQVRMMYVVVLFQFDPVLISQLSRDFICPFLQPLSAISLRFRVSMDNDMDGIGGPLTNFSPIKSSILIPRLVQIPLIIQRISIRSPCSISKPSSNISNNWLCSERSMTITMQPITPWRIRIQMGIRFIIGL